MKLNEFFADLRRNVYRLQRLLFLACKEEAFLVPKKWKGSMVSFLIVEQTQNLRLAAFKFRSESE